MPIYEYQCSKCGTFELVQRITESPIRKCPTCKGKVERLMSRTSFVLKGSGWYATDYARASKPEAKETKPGATPANGDAAASSASKSDSGSSSETAKPAKSSSSETAKPAGSEKNAAK